ncbi:hypothetical protein SAMN05428978_101219 [Nitrosomonas sp. Nm34]|nr:hypothetical protein SAMN05428978_101219 [Nitrosomonas sp. Nm34]
MVNTHSQENNINYEINNTEQYLADKLLLVLKSAYFIRDKHYV